MNRASQLILAVGICALVFMLMHCFSRRRPDPIVLPPQSAAVRRRDLARRAHTAQEDRVAAVRAVQYPEAILRLQALTHEFIHQNSWGALLDMGDIYRRGWFPLFKPDAPAAQACYMSASLCPSDTAAASLGGAKLAETMIRLTPEDVSGAGQPLPTHFADAAVLHARNLILAPAPRQTPPEPQPQPAPRPVIAPAAANAPVIEFPRRRDPALNGRHRHELQNVHDHGVQNAVHNSLKTLAASYSTDPASAAKAMAEVQAALDNHPTLDPAEKQHALQVLRSMESSANPHSRIGLTEGEVLDLVWQRTSAIQDPALRMNCLETLGKQLASGVEDGLVVCSTGRLSRAVGALDGIAEDVSSSKPLWAVKDELATLAARVREQTLSAAAEPERAAYDAGESPALESQMRDDFTRQARETYVEGLGMSADIVGPLVKTMEEAF